VGNDEGELFFLKWVGNDEGDHVGAACLCILKNNNNSKKIIFVVMNAQLFS